MDGTRELDRPMRILIAILILIAAPAFAAEEIVEAAIDRKSDRKMAPITNVDPTQLTAMLGMAVRRDFYQRSAPRARVERLQRLMPRPLEPTASVIPELGGIVVLANHGRVGLEVDLGGDLSIAID